MHRDSANHNDSAGIQEKEKNLTVTKYIVKIHENFSKCKFLFYIKRVDLVQYRV